MLSRLEVAPGGWAMTAEWTARDEHELLAEATPMRSGWRSGHSFCCWDRSGRRVPSVAASAVALLEDLAYFAASSPAMPIFDAHLLVDVLGEGLGVSTPAVRAGSRVAGLGKLTRAVSARLRPP